MQPEADVDIDLEAQSVILAAAQHNTDRLRILLRSTPVNVQDRETGSTPLHAAIAACEPCEPEPPSVDANGHGVDDVGDFNGSRPTTDEEAAIKTVKFLLQHGAIWNDLDHGNETPGCIAYRLGFHPLYDLMVDAGVRAEMLMNRMDEYQPIDDNDEGDDIEAGTATDAVPATEEAFSSAHDADAALAVGVDAPGPEVDSGRYLQSHLTFQGDRLLDADCNGVMMAWETGIMKRTAALLLPGQSLRVLNVGHGMGIVDECFQSQSPSAHHIIEAHPAVLTQLRGNGWYDKPSVTIHEGRWQDVLPKLLADNVMFDAIYFDTFAEDYKALRLFFSEYVLGLLDAQGGADGNGGRWSFFNGLGADRQICYDVYSKLVEMDLFEAGFDTDWEEVAVPNLDATEEWKGPALYHLHR
ncbi:MAG: Arginine N-methyltransferase 2 [Thelocarpon superellum]|nr:MAG: Arginine N-methyltransferase 2 [Thelocarpon superellum]